MNNHWRSLALLAWLCASALDASANTQRAANLSFNNVRVNPWTGGPPFEETFPAEQPLKLDFQFDIPPISANPAAALLRSFLGLDVNILSASAGGSVSGRAGIDFGYYVTGGRANFQYPGFTTLDIETRGNTTEVSSTQFRVDSTFTPGLTREFAPPVALTSLAGSGYGDDGIPGFFGAGRMQAPRFETFFPYASAWAEAYVQADLAAYVEAVGVELPVVGCIACVRKDFSVQVPEQRYTLIDIDPTGVTLADQRVIAFDQPFAITPFTTITPSYPDVRATGGLVAGSFDLQGYGEKPIIKIQGSYDDLVPLVGQLLDGNVGPVGYTLASLDGGPQLSLYQDFRLDVTAKLRLAFSERVNVSVAGGAFFETRDLTYDVGQSLAIRPIVSLSGLLEIQPTYLLAGRFFNETGLVFDVIFDVDGPTLDAGFGELGPFGQQTLELELARFAVYENDFDIPTTAIRGQKITLEKALRSATIVDASTRLLLQESTLISEPAQGSDLVDLRLRFVDPATNQTHLIEITGHLAQRPDDNETLVITDTDQIIRLVVQGADGQPLVVPFDLGRVFCVFCNNYANAFLDPSPSFVDSGDRLFLSRIDEVVNDNVCIACNPILGQANLLVRSPSAVVVLGETRPFGVGVRVPTPAWTGVVVVVLLLTGRRLRASGVVAS